MQKILITGASGFVGSFLVEEALKRGLEVYAGVRSTSSRKYLQDKRIHIFELDFGNLSDLRDRLQQVNFDFVIHNAGVVTVNDKQDFFKYNTELTTNFARILQEVQPDLKKFTYISSAAAYGPAPQCQTKPAPCAQLCSHHIAKLQWCFHSWTYKRRKCRFLLTGKLS